MNKSASHVIFVILSAGLASAVFASTPLPCVPNGHSAAPIFDRPGIVLKDVEANSGILGATWEDGTGDPEGASLEADPIIHRTEFVEPVDVFLLNGVGPSAFVSLENHDGVFSYMDHKGEWHEIDDYDTNPFVDGCIHLRVCWTVIGYKIVTSPAPVGHIGVSKGVDVGVDMPLGVPEPKVIQVDLSFCEEQEVCPC